LRQIKPIEPHNSHRFDERDKRGCHSPASAGESVKFLM
jgi:hypothetical protein